MDPLIITATPNISWLHPEIEYPRSPDAIAQEASRCREAGATIFHMHAENQWQDAIRAVRSKTDMIIQCGMSSLEIPERMEVYLAKADMISIILNHHDEAFVNAEFHVLHRREELEEYASLSAKYGVALEFEVWNTGSIWNLNYLISKGVIGAPYFTTLFFGWPGGTWSPPTIEEYFYRRKFMPDGCVVNVSVMGEEQIKLLTAAILSGDHVRVGTEDFPYSRSGKATSTPELVHEIVEVARSIGRQIASVSDARRILSLQGE